MYGIDKKSIGRGRPPKKNPIRVKRYNLVLPYDLYEEMEGVATAEHSTVIDAFKRIIKYGLLAYKVMKDPSSQLIIREGDSEREIVLT